MAEREEEDVISRDAAGRDRWGTDAAGLLIFRPDGRVFLALRSHEVMDPGVWGIPGGRIEPGEDAWTAAWSEALEELHSMPPLREVDKRDTMKSGDFTYTTFVVEVRDQDAESWLPTLNWENDEWGWFALDALPDPLHENVKRVLGRYR